MRRKPYTDRGISRVPCVKCGRPSKYQWRICSTNAWSAVCGACDLAINTIVAEWAFGKQKAAPLLDRYRRQFPTRD